MPPCTTVGKPAMSGLPLQMLHPQISLSLHHVPYYLQPGQHNRSSQTHLQFACPTLVHRFVALTFLERHKRTSIHLDRRLMAVPSKPNWVNQWLSYRGLVWSYLEEHDGSPTPISYVTAKSHPIVDDGLMEDTSRSLLSVSLPFPAYSSITQDHLQLGWAGGRSRSWNLRGGYRNPSLGCH